MSQLTKRAMSFDHDKSQDLFDMQCILDSMPCSVALFDKTLKLVKWNKNFSTLFGGGNRRITKNSNIKDVLSVPIQNDDLVQENNKTISLISEMNLDSNPDNSLLKPLTDQHHKRFCLWAVTD